MGSRERQPELQKLFDAGIPVYSISKLDTINNCLYESYRTYVLHKRGKNSVYGLLGTGIHDCLEKITNNEATESDLIDAMNNDLLEADTLGLKFPTDRQGGDSIRDGWVANITHFCNTYKAPKGKFDTEKFFLYKSLEGNYVQGYIDLIKHNKDESVDIYDYKTSTVFSKADLESHGRQLIIYSLGLEQAGLKVGRVAWIFLKYCTVKFVGKKTARSKDETNLEKNIERRKIVKELEKHIVAKLEKKGFDELDIECIMHDAKDSNEIPKEVADEFKISPYVMYYDLNEETKEECNNYIDTTVKMWESLCEEEDYPHRPFTRMQKNGKEVSDSFFCNNLCNHRDDCIYIKEYNEAFNAKKGADTSDDEDLFG